MVKRMAAPVRRQLGDYLQSYNNMSHNSRTYLGSVLLQTIGASIIACVFGLYMKAAGMGEASLGYVEGSIALSTALVALFGAPLVASFGYRSLMLGSLAILVASRFAQALTPTATVLIGLAAVVGLGDGFLRTVNSAFFAEHSRPEERTDLFAVEFLLRMLGVFAGGIAGGLLPALVPGGEVAGYQWTMTIGGLVAALGLIPISRVDEKVEIERGIVRAALQTGREFRSWGHLLRLAAPQAFLVMAGAMTGPFIPLYLKHELGASVSQVGLIQGAGALVVGIAAFATPAVRRRLGVGRAVTRLQLLAVPFLAAVPYVGGLAAGVALLYTRSSLMGASAPLYSELSMESVSAKDKPLVGGGLLFLLSIVAFAGNVIGGTLMERSYTAPYVPAAFLYMIGTAVTWVLWVYVPGKKMARQDELGLELG